MDLGSRDGRIEQGRRIQAAAEAAGYSLAELARRLGCSRALLYQYLSGQVLAQPDKLQQIAQLCGRPLAWFYATDDEALPAAEGGGELDRRRAELEAERLDLERHRAVTQMAHLTALAAAQGAPPDFAAQRQTCERLAERARDLGDPAQVADADYRLGNACYAVGDLDGARAAMSRAIEGFRALGDAERGREARQTLGAALAGLGERDRALREFDAVAAGGTFGDAWRGRLGRADVLEALGRGEEALAELAAADALIATEPESPDRRWAELYVAAGTANVYLLHDDFAAAVAAARRCAPLAEELACVDQHLEARINVGFAAHRLGDLATALTAFDEAVRLARLTGHRERGAVALACRAELAASLGWHDRARAEGKDALAAALGLGSVRGEVLAHLALAVAYRRSGEGHEAVYHAQQGLAAAAGHGLVKSEAVLRCELARGRRLLGESAAAEARRAAALAEAIGARQVQATAALLLADGAPDAAEQLALARRLSLETGDWELHLEAAVAEARRRGDAKAWQAALQPLWERRDRLVEAGLEAGLLEDPARLTAVLECIILLRQQHDQAAAEALLAAAAWPPLAALLEQQA